jgi:hypothetical protein
MRRLLGITLGSMIGIAVYAATTTAAQQEPNLTCSPTSVPSEGGGVWVSCSIENFPPNTQVTVTEAFVPSPLQVTTTDDAGQASFTFLIPEAGVCAQRSGGLTIRASGGDAEASMTMTPVPLPPLYCGPAGAVPAQPGLTG